MPNKTIDPAAQARADRVGVTLLEGSNDTANATRSPVERQASHILKFYALSRSVALVIAEHAFCSGRRR